MKKSFLINLLETFDINAIEKHFILHFLKRYKIDYSNNEILCNYLLNFEQSTEIQTAVNNIEIKTLKELENYLELLIPIKDRKLNGAFFTPTYIVDFIIEEIKPKEFHKNIDLSCGSGAFLIGLAEYYKNRFQKSIKKTIRENIFGSDILDYNIRRAKLLLTIFALQNNENLVETDFNLYVQDSLKAKWNNDFDNVVGNPPYIKFQDLSEENRNYLAQNWVSIEGGAFNIYFAFLELGHKLLTPTGKLGYITPNNYFTSLAATSIRKYFQQNKCVARIIDFSHHKVFDAQTYTALTFLNKKQNEGIMFDRITENYKPEEFLPIANGSLNYFKDLNEKKWRLLKTDERNNIETIERIGTPISTLFDICVGIATLKDEVFFIDSRYEKNGYYIKTTVNGIFKIEKEITKPVYKISNFKSQNEIKENNKRIICPYHLNRKTAIPIQEDEFKLKYPNCYNYLLSEKNNLSSRDKGKIIFEPFFAWGRTQGLNKIGRKITTPTFSLYPRFLIVEDEEAFFTNGYGLFFREQQSNLSLFDQQENPITLISNINALQKILNSEVMHYYVTKTSVSIQGGYPCYQKNFIEKFTIPLFSNKEIDILKALHDKSEIDRFLFDKYQLNLPMPNLAL